MSDDLISQLSEIAALGGTTLVTAMTTDLWDGVRDRVAGLLSGGDRRRASMQRTLLEDSRLQLQRDGDGGPAVRSEWVAALRQALLREPALALPLATLLDELAESFPRPAGQGSVIQRAWAERKGVVVQAGRDVVQLPLRGTT